MNAKKVFYLIFAIYIVFFTSCAVKRQAPIWIYKAPYSKKYYIHYKQIGYASWYGKKFQGRPTASGEIYNMYALTAAHRTLPLGTYVRVTNLSNGKSVVVKINDRGPYVKGRIIDLSYAAAKKIGMVEKGVQKVKIETISVPYYIRKYKNIFAYRKYYSVQIGSFRIKNNAILMLGAVRRFTNKAFYKKVYVNGIRYYRVYAGKYLNKRSAERLLRRLTKKGFDGFVVELDE